MDKIRCSKNRKLYKIQAFITGSVLVAILAGCGISPESRVEYMQKNYSHRCVINGYKLNTPEHTDCMLEYYRSETGAQEHQLAEMKSIHEESAVKEETNVPETGNQ